jgi:hypothetical protein
MVWERLRFHNATISHFSESRQARECGVVNSGNNVIATCDHEATTPLSYCTTDILAQGGASH